MPKSKKIFPPCSNKMLGYSSYTIDPRDLKHLGIDRLFCSEIYFLSKLYFPGPNISIEIKATKNNTAFSFTGNGSAP